MSTINNRITETHEKNDRNFPCAAITLCVNNTNQQIYVAASTKHMQTLTRTRFSDGYHEIAPLNETYTLTLNKFDRRPFPTLLRV